MIVIAILLLLAGVIGLVMSTMMFGDIGVAAAIAAITALLSGIGFLLARRSIKSFSTNRFIINEGDRLVP